MTSSLGIATPSLGTVCTTLQGIWCRVVVLSVSPLNEPKSHVFPPKAIQMLKTQKQTFKYTKKYKSSIQYGVLPAGTVLNEPVLCMILFNSFHRHDFVTLKDFKDFNNEMLYTCKKSSLDFTKDLALMIILGPSVPFFLLKWQQSGRSEGSRVSSQTLTSKHMDWFTAGLDVLTAKLFLIPTGKLMVPAVYSYQFKELRCSAQCHMQMQMWIVSRGVVRLILLVGYRVLTDSETADFSTPFTSTVVTTDSQQNTRLLLYRDYSLSIGIFVQDKMSRDVITVGSTMRILLLYRGEYSQWSERFMNYLEEQTDGEAMINSIKNGEHPLPVTAEEKKTRKIDRLARSLLIQGLPNKNYSLIDSNNTTKDLWDALERQMCGSEYGEQDRKAAILYEYETFKATEGEQLLDTYLRYLQVIIDLKKCGYKKDNCELNYKFLSNLQPEWKQYGTLMRQTKNLMDINIDALYNILKQNQGDVNDAIGYKKKAIMVTSDPLSYSEGSDDEDISDLKTITALLAKVFNRKKYYAKPTNNNLRTSSANKKPEYVKTEEKKEDKKANENKRDMSKVKCYNFKKEGHFAKNCKKAKVKDYNY
ncbi:ribonuclease H-like domain-containing protein [Tanacetum coccineum]